MNDEERSKIPKQKIEIKQKMAEIDFLEQQLVLSQVRASTDGIIIADDTDSLIGTFLKTGQLVVRIADPAKTKLRLMVPATDIGLVVEGAPLDIRLDSDPFHSLSAIVRRVEFDVLLSDENVPSIVVDAAWKDNSPANINLGQRGTAKIKGVKTSFGLQLFRKPIIAFRTFFGI